MNKEQFMKEYNLTEEEYNNPNLFKVTQSKKENG